MNAQFRDGSVAAKIFALGKEVFESSGNKEIAALIGKENAGQVSNERAKVARETGWSMPGRSETTTPTTPRARKSSGSLPAKIEGFLSGLVEEIPVIWTPTHVLPVILEDSVKWNTFIRRMNDLDSSMVESFEKWLDHPATLSRMAEFMVFKEAAKAWDNKARTEALASELIALGYGDKSPSALLRELWL